MNFEDVQYRDAFIFAAGRLSEAQRQGILFLPGFLSNQGDAEYVNQRLTGFIPEPEHLREALKKMFSGTLEEVVVEKLIVILRNTNYNFENMKSMNLCDGDTGKD